MAGWIYDPDEGLIFEYREFPDTKNPVPLTIAENVNHDAGPTLVRALRMLEVIPELIGLLEGWGIRAGAITKARDILREIDEARESSDAQD
jgi:hypothetical protein